MARIRAIGLCSARGRRNTIVGSLVFLLLWNLTYPPMQQLQTLTSLRLLQHESFSMKIAHTRETEHTRETTVSVLWEQPLWDESHSFHGVNQAKDAPQLPEIPPTATSKKYRVNTVDSPDTSPRCQVSGICEDASRLQLQLQQQGSQQQQQLSSKGASSRCGPSGLACVTSAAARRHKVVQAALWSWKGYKEQAWGHDELGVKELPRFEATHTSKGDRGTGQRPVHTLITPTKPLDWLHMGLTIVDSLDTLLMMGLTAEYAEARAWVQDHLNFHNVPEPVSVFETTIRILGSLLSSFYLSGGDTMLLDKAVDLADRLLVALNTTHGVSKPSVRLGPLRDPAPSQPGEYTVQRNPYEANRVNAASVATLTMEFSTLARITGRTEFAAAAFAVWKVLPLVESCDGLFCTWFDSETLTCLQPEELSFGPSSDSLYEYMIKQYVMTGRKDQRMLGLYKRAVQGMRRHLVSELRPVDRVDQPFWMVSVGARRSRCGSSVGTQKLRRSWQEQHRNQQESPPADTPLPDALGRRGGSSTGQSDVLPGALEPQGWLGPMGRWWATYVDRGLLRWVQQAGPPPTGRGALSWPRLRQVGQGRSAGAQSDGQQGAQHGGSWRGSLKGGRAAEQGQSDGAVLAWRRRLVAEGMGKDSGSLGGGVPRGGTAQLRAGGGRGSDVAEGAPGGSPQGTIPRATDAGAESHRKAGKQDTGEQLFDAYGDDYPGDSLDPAAPPRSASAPQQGRKRVRVGPELVDQMLREDVSGEVWARVMAEDMDPSPVARQMKLEHLACFVPGMLVLGHISGVNTSLPWQSRVPPPPPAPSPPDTPDESRSDYAASAWRADWTAGTSRVSFPAEPQSPAESLTDDDLLLAAKLMPSCYDLYRLSPTGVASDVVAWTTPSYTAVQQLAASTHRRAKRSAARTSPRPQPSSAMPGSSEALMATAQGAHDASVTVATDGEAASAGVVQRRRLLAARGDPVTGAGGSSSKAAKQASEGHSDQGGSSGGETQSHRGHGIHSGASSHIQLEATSSITAADFERTGEAGSTPVLKDLLQKQDAGAAHGIADEGQGAEGGDGGEDGDGDDGPGGGVDEEISTDGIYQRAVRDPSNYLRPEVVESLWYLWSVTKDSVYREWGWAIFQAFEMYSRTSVGGYARLNEADRPAGGVGDRQESFWLAETLKYLFLLFSDDEDTLPLEFVLNTEAHPLPIWGSRAERVVLARLGITPKDFDPWQLTWP